MADQPDNVVRLGLERHRRLLRRPDQVQRLRGAAADLRQCAGERQPDPDHLLHIAKGLEDLAAEVEAEAQH